MSADAANLKNSEAPVPPSSLAPTLMIYRERGTYTLISRTIDIVGGLVLLLVAAPILVLAGLAIFLEDGGPILFCQRRVGRFGRLFTIYKLRTMKRDRCGDSFSPTGVRDPRVTRVGYFLRRFSIDELPQLVNIIIGDMAFVGPRPEMPFIVRNYESWQHLRHLVTPGITGFWQTTCRSTIPLHLPEATALDLDYIRQASPATDCALILKTVRSIIAPQGAY